MAKMTKKIQHNIAPREEKKEAPKPKPGKDYLLIGVILATVFIGAVGWQQFDNLNRAMYLMLAASLTLTYVQRHFDLPENRMKLVNRAGIAAMIIAVVLFAVTVYRTYFAG